MRELPSPIVTIRSDPECRSFPRLPWVARQQQRGKGGSHGQANETGCARRGWWASSRSLTLVIAGAAIGAQGYNGPARQVYQGGNPTCPDGLPTPAARASTAADLQGGYNDGRISITRRGVVNGIDSFDWVIVDHSVDVDGRHRQGRRRRVHLLLRLARRELGRTTTSRRRSTTAARRRRSATPCSASTRRTRRTRCCRSRSRRAARRRSRTAGRSTSRSSRPARPTRRTATTPCSTCPTAATAPSPGR